MNASAIIRPLFVWCLMFGVTSQFVANVVLHQQHLPAAWLAGATVGLWFVLPMVRPWQIERYSRLDPVPKRYLLTRQLVLEKLADVLPELGWQLRANNSSDFTLSAYLPSTRETSLASMKATIKQSENSCILCLHTKVQQSALNSDELSTTLSRTAQVIDEALGRGTDITNLALYTVKAPPWWLLLLSATMIGAIAIFVSHSR